MNKKFLFGMFAAASMLLATSCTSDDLDGAQVQSGKEATVAFTLGVENGAQTRVISDGKKADQLHYAVFEGNKLVQAKKVKDGVSFPYDELTLTLVKGKTYQVAFWAQDADCDAYEVDENMNVDVDYAGVNNDESRDAFFTTVGFTVAENTTVKATLKRPFAQLNVGVSQKDYDTAAAVGATISTSKVQFSNAATSINLLTGEVSGKADVTYDVANIPTEDLTVGKNTYKYLSMCYLLANADGDGTDATIIDNVKFSFTAAGGNYGIELADGLTSVPARRNWRTNILLSQFLTSDIKFEIKLDSAYNGDSIEWGTLVPEEKPAVDPSLPGLSVEWATKNVGAATPEELGTYYAWGGNVDGLTKYYYDADRDKDVYTNNWITYEWYTSNGDNSTTLAEEMKKYNPTDGFTTLLADDDVATTMGKEWRTPTKEEMQELIDECTWTWNAEKKGFDVVEDVDEGGQSIFLPAGGYYRENNNTDNSIGSYCCYWTATLTDNWTIAYSLEAGEKSSKDNWINSTQFIRAWGVQIRPVRAK